MSGSNGNDVIDAEVVHESRSTEIVPASSLGMVLRAEIDTQIATAKQYPRSLATFKRTALAMATLDEETAASCFYALSRSGKTIEGPSVRLAEIVGSAWGNIRYGARVVADNGKIVTAQGFCHDMERNVSATVEVSRRVTGKNGQRYSDDMVIVTQNAASAIALRNAILKVIPAALIRDIYLQARKTAVGDAKTLASKRGDMLAYFGKLGIDEKRVCHAVGKLAVEDVGLDELATLKGLATAIKDGDTTVDEAFPAIETAHKPATNGNGHGKPTSKTDALAERMKAAPPEEAKQPDAPNTATTSTPQDDSTSPPEANELEIGDAVLRIREQIAAAATVIHLQDVGAEMTKARDFIGEENYAELLTAYQARMRAMEPRKAAAAGGKKATF